MLTLLQQNLATIVVATILVCIVMAIVRKTIKDKRNGLWSCSCNCQGCPLAADCQTEPLASKTTTAITVDDSLHP